MRFSTQSFLGCATALLSLANPGLASDDCTYNSDFMLPIEAQSDVSTAPGGYYCAGEWSSGLIIKGLQAWGDGHRLTGIQFTYSDNSQSVLYGKTYGEPQGISWDVSKESVKSFNIMGAYHEAGVGRIMLTTTGGQSYSFGGDTGSFQGTSVNVGAGIIMGAVGSSGDWLDNLGLIFLANDVKSIAITDVQYDQDLAAMNAKQTGLTNTTLADVYYTNPGNTSRSFSFEPTQQWQNTYAFTQGSQTTWGASVGVSMTIGEPEVFGITASASASWEMQTMTQTQWTQSFTSGITWSETGDIPFNGAVHCTSSSMSGTFDSDYTSTVEAQMSNGKSFTFKERGTYKGSSWSQAVTSCADINLEDIPSGSKTSVGTTKKRAVEFSA